ncbi:MAG: biotin/lipoyl-containing protein, partial [Flavobacteriales bacterium]
MAEVVYMPKLSDTMTEGVVAAWTKKVGDAVKSGEVLAEIETDKATMEFESFFDGVLLHIGVETGQAAPVNSVLAIIGEAGEDISSVLANAAAGAPGASATAEPAPTSAPSPAPAAQSPVAAPVAAPAPTATPVATPVNTTNSDRVFASPLAKKLAAERGINIGAVAGTGENGRIV